MTKTIAQIIESNDAVFMQRHHWRDLPGYTLPPGYSLRFYQPGDATQWVTILSEAFGDNNITREFFTQRFGNNEIELSQRQIFLYNESEEAIGTATAWLDNFEGDEWGRVRSVAILPEYQGKHLVRPLLSAVCERFHELGHEGAFLDTSTKRFSAIKLYWHFGFRPHLRDENDARIWHDLETHLRRH